MSYRFIALLNPAIAVIMAAAFLLAWTYQRQRRDLAALPAHHPFSAVGCLLQRFTLPIGFGRSRPAWNPAFPLAAAPGAFAYRVKKAAGGRSVAGSLRGEEFARLLPCSNLAAARQFGEAMRVGFSAASIEGLPRQLRAATAIRV